VVARSFSTRTTGRRPRAIFATACLAAALTVGPRGARAQQIITPARGDSINIHLLDVDVRTAVQALAAYLDRPVVLGAVQNTRVSVETPRPVARGDVVRLLRSVLESQNLDLVIDTTGGVYRVQPKEPPKDADGNPLPYDPNRPPNATGQGQPQIEQKDAKDKEDEKKTNPLKKIFGIFGGKKKDSDKPKSDDTAKPDTAKPDNKGDSP